MFTRTGAKMDINIVRKVMWVFIACCILKANQAVAGDLYPEQAAAGLWHIVEPSSLPLNDQLENTTYFTRELKSTNGKIQWFIDNIVKIYGFKENEKKNKWIEQGQFRDFANMEKAYRKASEFFKEHSTWATTKATFKADSTGQCSDLLAITAARYLLVTHILWEQSGKQLIPCKRNGKIVTIPPSVCYPEPYGSARCTSDYDVGLVGPRAGELVGKFNNYFQSQFKKSSDEVLDTNIYAFSLEFSIPKGFIGLPRNFAASVAKKEESVKLKMQELVSAYYKVFKHSKDFFNQLRNTASVLVKGECRVEFNNWDEKYIKLDKQVPLVPLGGNREAQNEKYQELVKQIGTSLGGPYEKENIEANLETLDISHLYAAEAYHTRGAVRHVVGGIQMKLADYATKKLTTMGLWTSMIENWGDSIKVYKHDCFDDVILEVCLLKMSKYMWRMLDAMRNLRQRIRVFHVSKDPEGQTVESNMDRLVSFSGKNNPEEIMRSWLDNKKRGLTKITSDQKVVSQFFEKFDCPGVTIGKPFPRECLVAINNKVDKYNEDLTKMFVKNHQVKFSIKDKEVHKGFKTFFEKRMKQ